MQNVFNFMLRVFFWLMFILLLLFLSFVLLDLFGIFNSRVYMPSFIKNLIFRENLTYTQTSSIINLDDIRMKKEREAIDIRGQEILNYEKNLLEIEVNLKRLESELEEKARELESKQKIIDDIINKYKNEEANIEQSAMYLMNMPPQKAVENLKNLEDSVAISYIRKVEEIAKRQGKPSIVSYWLSLMDSQRAADLIRKLSLSPVE